MPWDGESVGEIEVRGPWITASYYHVDDPEKFHDGWLRTGDVASVSPNGFVMITDRAKDVIKSGGEWVSSVDLENTLMGHPDVAEAAVIGVPDERWDERPLACVVRRSDSEVTAAELRGWLAERTAKLLPARAVDVHRRGPEDERRQVRQEGAARPSRRRPARRGDAEVVLPVSRRYVRGYVAATSGDLSSVATQAPSHAQANERIAAEPES